jgi:cystathionine beta-lyase
MYLGLRGVRTLPQRLRQHQETARVLADWLQAHPDVRRVLHPALPDHPGHACWARDFHGATGLFGFVLPPTPRPALAAMLDSMDLFGMGFSWGGFESLLLPSNPRPLRSATRFDEDGQVMRLHAGLEDVDDLIEDLGAALTRRRAVLDE